MHDGGRDPGARQDFRHLLKAEIGDSNRLAPAVLDKILHGRPGVRQGDAVVVYHLAVGVTWILLVAGFEGKGRVYEVQINIVQAEPRAAGLEGRLDVLRPVVVVPELGCDEEIFPPYNVLRSASRSASPTTASLR